MAGACDSRVASEMYSLPRALSGVLRSLSVNDLPVGRNPDEVLRQVQVRACLGHLRACGLSAYRTASHVAMQAFKFTDLNGNQVCPAGWRPGKKTMAPAPKESKEYFASAEYAGAGGASSA